MATNRASILQTISQAVKDRLTTLRVKDNVRHFANELIIESYEGDHYCVTVRKLKHKRDWRLPE